MKKLIIHQIIVIILLLSAGSLSAQSNPRNITTEITAGTLSEALQQLDNSTPFKIFHQVDAKIKYSGERSFAQQDIASVLGSILEDSFYDFIEYRGYGWVVVDKTILERDYSAEFYNALSGQDDEEETTMVIGQFNQLAANGMTKLTGIVSDVQSGEAIIGATLSVSDTDIGTVSDIDGSYELILPAGTHQVVVNFIGYQDSYTLFDIRSDGMLDVSLDKGAIELDEVTIRARAADASVENVQIGVQTLSMNTIKKLPTFMGEVDVIKSFLLQPGVTTIGEGASGFNVRGGNVDQNLIMQDEAFLFNSSHALGFFSTFNADLINKVDLYKANIPAQYGGRLVSVMDVEMKDGDFERFKIKGGVGPVSSKISFEGPVIKDKVSIIGGFRSSYTDWVLNLMTEPELKNSSAFFYDGNFRLTIKPNANHNLSISGYASQDEFVYNNEFGFDYQTRFAELSYGLIIGDNIFSNLSVVGSTYNSDQTDFAGIDASTINTKIDYVKIKENIKYIPNESTEINVGLSTIQYNVGPGAREPFGDISTITPRALEDEKGRESAVYANARFSLSDAFEISGGARFNYFQFLGPKTEYQYTDEFRPSVEGIIGTELKTGTLQTYSYIEPRVSARLKLSDKASIKAGYSRTSQFINQIFNADAPTPTSQWQLSNRYIKPLRSHNASIGYFQNFKDNEWETSFEIYAREIDQLFDFKDFASLLINDHIETELLNGNGRAYGAEVSIRKNVGKTNGWLSYTYARSERQIEGINDGDWYPSNFDKTHDVSFIMNYNPNQRNTMTMNINYSTGRPTTPPVGNYRSSGGLIVPIFSERNALRIPDYFRVDLSYTLGKGYKKDQKFNTSWTISVYNVLGRRNPFTVFFTQAPFDLVQANKLSILGSAFPSITVNFELL